MELKARECPNCRRLVSIRTCSKYLLRGTNYSIYCNHCNKELALIKEPIPFKWCQFIGFLSTVIPAVYFLFFLKLGFDKSMLLAALFGVLGILTVSIFTFKRSYFKIV